ncbi:MAG: dGTP triphosphohydrolase [Bacteroidota bacterium]
MSKGKGLFLELKALKSAQKIVKDNLYLTEKFKGILQPNDELDGISRGNDKFYDKRNLIRIPSIKLYQEVDYKKYYKEEVFEEDEYDFESQFRIDLARVINSHGFRRLCGKTQLFPANESDFFRNRLTHSLEVAQVAKSIAIKLNRSIDGKSKKINLELVKLAGLAHDIGHPPFGHQGEEILAERMKPHGGFEGNAQTIRLLTRLEKRIHTGDIKREGFQEGGIDRRGGLNLSFRALASVLKYDNDIGEFEQNPINDKFLNGNVIKGYYSSEKLILNKMKEAVVGEFEDYDHFETIECQIMDLADDIAYSTYDLEDAFKAGFISPVKMLSQTTEFYDRIAKKVNKNLKSKIDNIGAKKIDASYIRNVLSDLCIFLFDPPEEVIKGFNSLADEYRKAEEYMYVGLQYASLYDELVIDNGYVRNNFSSQLIRHSINGVSIEYNEKCPPLSKLKIDDNSRIRIEILKQLAFNTQVLSPRLKANEYRGKRIVETIFDALDFKSRKEKVPELLPDDFKVLFAQIDSDEHRYRTICDYIACMTDRYAVNFYSRITSINPTSIFIPY